MLIANVQESLARKARYQPNTRFDDLFNIVAHPHVLWVAAAAILQNDGANTAGVDGLTGADFEKHLDEHTLRLSAELAAGSYQPSPVKRVYITKANGKLRPLGIPTIRDRVVQEAVRMVLEPIFESHFLNCSTGFRPGRRTMDAAHLITRFSNNQIKMWWVVEGDIKGCFDTIPQRKLLGVLRQYIQDKQLLALLQQMLGAGIVEKGKVSRPNTGVPQGGVVSPLLANIYLHELDKVWWERYGDLDQNQKTRRRAAGLGNVQLVRYADDFVLLTNGDKAFAQQLRDEFGEVLQTLGLELSAEKSQVTHINDGFDFLGFHFERVHSTMSNKSIVLVTPSQQNIALFKGAVEAITSRSSTGDDPVNKIRALNSLIRGWAGYYRHVNASDCFDELEHYVYWRVYHWLKAKHSALSAHRSVKAYVVRNYRVRRGNRHVWGVHGVKLVPLTSIARKRYYIKWPEGGNPYLTQTNLLVTKDDVPLPDPEQLWRGNSAQSAYAVERLKRMEQVGHKCEECGTTVRLQAHHRKPQREGGNHTSINLQILCEACHIKTYSANVPPGPV